MTKSTAKQSRAPRAQSASSSPWLKVSRSGANLNVEDFLTFRLTRLSNALRANLTRRYLAEFDLSLPEWRLLALVARFAPMRFSEVTSRSGMDKGQVSRTLRAMEQRGMVRMKTIRARGQSAEVLAAPVMVSITAKGTGLYRNVLPVARKRQAEMLLTLSSRDRVELYSVIDKLFATVGSVPTGDAETE